MLQKQRRNYLSKKGFQFRLIGKLLFIAAVATVLSIVTTSLLYYKLSNVPFKGDIPFYYVTDDIPQGKGVPTALDVLIPGLLVCGVVMVAFTLFLGIVFTHRIAGAIYRIQKSCVDIGEGDLSMNVRLREKDELHDMANDLNGMVKKIRNKIRTVQNRLDAITLILSEKDNLKKEKKLNSLIKEAQEAIGEFKLESGKRQSHNTETSK
jgi:methyl-accepting chemotaxis protein